MAETHDTLQMIARDITLAIIEKMGLPGPNTEPDAVGERAGKLYKAILEQIREPEKGPPKTSISSRSRYNITGCLKSQRPATGANTHRPPPDIERQNVLMREFARLRSKSHKIEQNSIDKPRTIW